MIDRFDFCGSVYQRVAGLFLFAIIFAAISPSSLVAGELTLEFKPDGQEEDGAQTDWKSRAPGSAEEYIAVGLKYLNIGQNDNLLSAGLGANSVGVSGAGQLP